MNGAVRGVERKGFIGKGVGNMWIEDMIIFNNTIESKKSKDNTLIACNKLVPLMTPKEIATILKVMDKVLKRLERKGKTK